MWFVLSDKIILKSYWNLLKIFYLLTVLIYASSLKKKHNTDYFEYDLKLRMTLNVKIILINCNYFVICLRIWLIDKMVLMTEQMCWITQIKISEMYFGSLGLNCDFYHVFCFIYTSIKELLLENCIILVILDWLRP
jgi:hypothetical protein